MSSFSLGMIAGAALLVVLDVLFAGTEAFQKGDQKANKIFVTH